MLRPKRLTAVMFVLAALLLATITLSSDVSAIVLPLATSPTLDAVASYSVLAGSVATNTGPTTLSGDLGVSPSIGVPPHITGFPPGIVSPPGTIHDADTHAAAAQADNTTAFGTLDQPCDTTYPGVQDLALVSPLVAGVYCATAFTLSGQLELSGSGVWIFKSASTLITSPGSSVIGGDPCNVWWRVGSSATLDTTTSFRGNILALTSITMNTGATLNGRALAQTGAVTMDTNTISMICAPPTAVELLYFMASRNGPTVVLTWATAEEIDNYGFNLYRAPVDHFAQAELIHFEPSKVKDGTGSGATYQYLDTPPSQDAWWYWLADIDTHGIGALFDSSVAIDPELQFKVNLPWIANN